MTTNDAPGQAPPTVPPVERKLSRSRDRRVIAGVCGGLGRYCGVDPVIFRIALAVLVFFGGVGAVIYLAAWLFLPNDGDTASPVEALLGRGTSTTSAVTTVILAVIGIAVLALALHGESVVLLAVAVIAIVLLARREPAAVHPVPDGVDPGAGGPAPPQATAYAPHGPYAGNVAGGPVSPPPVKPPKPRSALGRIVVSATLLVLGLMAIADRLLDASIPAPAYAAVALAMVGAGLVVGTWFGRSRGLIGLGVALCLVLALMTAADKWEPGKDMGNQRWAPVAVAEIEPEYEISFGDGTLDLTKVNFTDSSATTRLSVGFGHLLVRVPSNVDVTVRGRAGAGNVNLFGEQRDGNDINRTVTDLGADGAGGGTLNLDVKVGVGELEVLRG